jgi:hypothetical protein
MAAVLKFSQEVYDASKLAKRHANPSFRIQDVDAQFVAKDVASPANGINFAPIDVVGFSVLTQDDTSVLGNFVYNVAPQFWRQPSLVPVVAGVSAALCCRFVCVLLVNPHDPENRLPDVAVFPSQFTGHR